jgi:hypothetical protein
MPYFRVQLHGTGICLFGSGSEPPIVGFYTTRIVRAESREAAATVAARSVTAQWGNGTAYAKNNRSSLPMLSVEWVKDDTFLGSLLFRGTGHTFYPADPSRAPEGVAD